MVPSPPTVYLGYYSDSTIFGTNIVSRGAITASKGMAVDSPYYNMSLTDSTSTMLKIAITHTPSPASLANLDSVNQQLCHLRVNVTGFNLASVGAYFDTLAMVGHSDYQQTPSGIEFPYDKILVSGLVGSLRDDETISFTLDSFVVNDSTNTISFSVFATSSPDPTALFSAGIIINFDTAAFGPFIYGRGFVGADAGALSLDYDITPSDQFLSGTELELDITNFTGNYDTVNGSPIDVADITISFFEPRCLHSAGITGDNFNTPYDSSYYWDDMNNVPVGYVNSSVSGQYNSVLCPIETPHVSSISSDCIGAGTFDTLTITGTNFGSSQGAVFFTNADVGGSFFQCIGADILLWTPTQIQMYVPSYPNTAASGNFYIQNAVGTANSADSNKINIGYAVSNFRNPYDSTAQPMFRQDTPFVFQLDVTLWNTPGVIATVQHVMADMNCQMGVNFSLDTSGPSAINSVYQSFINLISIQPSTYSPFQSDSAALAYTDRLENIVTCVTNLQQYNNIARQVHQVNISFRATPSVAGYTWNWSDADTPTNHQFDFATVLAHELGHAAMLEHNRPQFSGDVMYASISNGEMLRVYDNDPNDIGGVYRALSIGTVQGTAGGCGYSAQTFSGTCTRTAYACMSYYPQLGISDIATSQSFSAWLYPNPYQDNTVVHIDVSEYGNFAISIYDVIGHLISEQHITSATSFDVPISGFQQSAGIYLVLVSDIRSRLVFKMVKL